MGSVSRNFGSRYFLVIIRFEDENAQGTYVMFPANGII